MEHPRITSARDHDDSALIAAAENAPTGAGSAGGNLARDVGSLDELAGIGEPDGHTRATKQADIANNTATRNDRAR